MACGCGQRRKEAAAERAAKREAARQQRAQSVTASSGPATWKGDPVKPDAPA